MQLRAPWTAAAAPRKLTKRRGAGINWDCGGKIRRDGEKGLGGWGSGGGGGPAGNFHFRI